MGTMSIPDHTGHRSVAWHATDPVSVMHAQELFRSLTAQRLVPFARTAEHGGATDFEQVRAFDPSVDEIMWVRPLQGG